MTVEIDTDLTGTGSLCDQNNDQKGAYCVVVGAGVSLPAGKTARPTARVAVARAA